MTDLARLVPLRECSRGQQRRVGVHRSCDRLADKSNRSLGHGREENYDNLMSLCWFPHAQSMRFCNNACGS